ncbi:uncharacterized protein F4822DRAFT_412889 [Hypoxylon trugodes]|uniref:uncharacterized protein n=1 Tax=Hypoxylon trugodes TaxID=326681 RepID=UPI00219AE208|nr:uncharacterized protein F4822DRAFT_412889 [Hypoxylon trugodes]KAI1385373.1 hypothetical protein F4822DRAFT_412889 [Hypoxylon trugodes]
MKLVHIDYKTVTGDVFTPEDSPRPSDRNPSQRFNSFFDYPAEEPHAIVPSGIPCSFKRWSPLILRTRGLSSSVVQTVTLSYLQQHLLLGHARSLPSSHLTGNNIDKDVMTSFAHLRFPPEGIFMRVLAYPPKDEAHAFPLFTAKGVIDHLISLEWTHRTLSNSLEPHKERLDVYDPSGLSLESFELVRNGREDIELIFVPFDHRASLSRRYRVFCPPARFASQSYISAISQYDWRRPWFLASNNGLDMARAAEKITRECDKLREMIVGELNLNNWMDKGMLSQGFTFDVLFDEERDVFQLIELDTFGTRSACGSCLFHWEDDAYVLHFPGSGTENTEFRVTY